MISSHFLVEGRIVILDGAEGKSRVCLGGPSFQCWVDIVRKADY